MQQLISYIHKNTKETLKTLKLKEVVLNKTQNLLQLVFLYPDELGFIEQEDKDKIFALTKEYLKLDINLDIKYQKNFWDKEYLRMLIRQYINSEFPAVSSLIVTKSLELSKQEEHFLIRLKVFKGYISDSQKEKLSKSVEKYLNSEFFEVFVLELLEAEQEDLGTSIIEQNKEQALQNISQPEGKKAIRVEVIKQIVGQDSSIRPYCASSITLPEENISVAGVVKNLLEREFTKKQKVIGAEKETYADVKKIFYSFYLEAAGKEINAVYFPTKNSGEGILFLKEGMEVVLTGDIELFNGKLSFKVKHITQVNILEKPKLEEQFKEAPANYKYVFPEDFETVAQASLFEDFSSPGEYLKNNTFIVFDLETTGLNHEDCQIVEIGAVKIEKGKITKKFSTFVDPEVLIPEDATRIHGITDAMVVGAPKIDEVIGDFYKFCEGSIIMAYNIDFDYKFINHYARKSGFLFNHTQRDILLMARQYIKGLKNYKLKTVVESLGITLNNAHRAYHDAEATAKVFLKLAENIK